MTTPIYFIGKYRVYFKDTDTGGVMYHSRYVEYLEMVRTDFFNHRGYSIRKILEVQHIAFPVIEIFVRYLQPAYLNDILTVELRVEKIIGARIFFSYQIWNSNRNILCEASTVNATVDVRNLKPVRTRSILPDLAREFF